MNIVRRFGCTAREAARLDDPAVAAAAPLLTRLARDKRGNTLAIMAMAILPLAGLIGGAVDMSRLYIVKTRLQQACDAGALAGRRTMGAGRWDANGNAANTAALEFFDQNYEDGAYGTNGRTRAFTEAAGRVSGTASVTVPMTIMRVFNQTSQTLTVTCDAEMRLPNTDIMFVLDTTGSMRDPIPGESTMKIATLRLAVKCFYETVARLDTNADCTPGTPGPTGGTGTQTQIRFGFVPYATNVNVGRLLPTNFIADTWPYQSREALRTEIQWTDGTPYMTGQRDHSHSAWGPWQNGTLHGNINSSAQCNALVPARSFTANGSEGAPYNIQQSGSGTNRSFTADTDQAYTETEYRGVYNSGARQCQIQSRTRTFTRTRSYRRDDTGREVTVWRYHQVTHNIRGLRNGTSWNAGVSLPIGANGTDTTVAWNGCIEERQTVRQAAYSPIPSGALDLNIDLVPSASRSGSFWGPALPGAVYRRLDDVGQRTTATVETPNDFDNPSADRSRCATEARRLQTWPTATAYDSYVDGLTTDGNTYHDIGAIWGARLMSPTGIFAADNALTPQGGEIERHMIFMTDGETCTHDENYQAYGIAFYDRRQTATGSAPSWSCDPAASDLTNQVNARFSAICTAVKNMNITLWVVYFDTTTDTATVNRMTTCATSGRFFYATNSAGLLSSFRTIADQISQLRLTR